MCRPPAIVPRCNVTVAIQHRSREAIDERPHFSKLGFNDYFACPVNESLQSRIVTVNEVARFKFPNKRFTLCRTVVRIDAMLYHRV